MLDMVLRIRQALRNEDRVVLEQRSNGGDQAGRAVMLLALITQVAIAVVHWKARGRKLAALLIFTFAAVSLLGLLAEHESPFRTAGVPFLPARSSDVLKEVPM